MDNKTLSPERSILLNKVRPGSRLGIKKIEARLQRFPEIVAGLFHKQVVLEELISNSRRQVCFILLGGQLNKHSLFSRNLGECFHNFIGSVVLGSGQNLLVVQFIAVFDSSLDKKTWC